MSAPFLHAQIHSPSTTPIIYTPPQRSQKKDFEVLFCSADHSEEEFDSYYNENMPNWLAVPYDESEREAIMSMYQGNRIESMHLTSIVMLPCILSTHPSSSSLSFPT